MREVAPIMTDDEFAKYLDRLKASIMEWSCNGQDYNAIRCRLMGYLQAEKTNAFTSPQLKMVFDLGFKPEDTK